MIDIKRGTYVYGGFTLAADFSVKKGQFVAVLGPSGAGKSTLLHILAGFESLQSGTIVLDGKSHTATLPAARPVSMVFQDNNSFAHLTAWQNVALGVAPSLNLPAGEQARVENALTRVGLMHLAHRRPGEMSGGERQRIALARVLVRDRPILLLDEPFAALGPGLRRDMMELVLDLHDEKQLTTLMVTHDPQDARSGANSIVFVSDGVVRAPVATEDFFALANDAAVTAYLG